MIYSLYFQDASIAMGAHSFRGTDKFPPTEEQGNPLLGMVAQYQSCFVDLQQLRVTLDGWSEDTIQKTIDNHELWKTHHLAHHPTSSRIKQTILIINFLAGRRFEALEMSSTGQYYKHSCGGHLYRLSTLEQMVNHIETHHHRQNMIKYDSRHHGREETPSEAGDVGTHHKHRSLVNIAMAVELIRSC